jgi:hypothetical protein
MNKYGKWEKVRKEFMELMATAQVQFSMLEAFHHWPERPVR